MVETNSMRRRMVLRGVWKSPGIVEWRVFGLGEWKIEGRFENCVSKKCLVERVRRIVKAPRRPPRRIYEVAESALGYLFGMIGDFGASSYKVAVGLNIGAADAYDRALANAVLGKLAPGHRAQPRSKFPELFLTAELTYDVYDCDGGCEGWWATVIAEYAVPGEWCAVKWSRYMGPDIDAVDRDAIRRVAYKALRHTYNTLL
jgi:hypothetical protein